MGFHPMDLLHSSSSPAAIMKMNQVSSKFGLTLTEQEASLLLQSHKKSLKRMGRIEFLDGCIQQLIFHFCDSPYINQDDYLCIMEELLDIFYYFKNASGDVLSDEELMLLMRQYYDEDCNGSIELLQAYCLERMTHNLKFNKKDYGNINKERDDELSQLKEYLEEFK